MKNNKGKAVLGLLGFLVVLGVFVYFSKDTMEKSQLITDENGVTSYQEGGIKLGLDLAGGVSITYQAVEENPSAEDMSDTQYKLQQRVQNYSSEAEVYQEGNNRINIDIPGVNDANEVLTELGKPGSLLFLDEDYNTVLEGTDVASAQAVSYRDQQTGATSYEVALTFTDEGAEKFAEVTEANIGKHIAIVYDDVLYSNPVVQAAITGGQASITGMTSYEEADQLASTIRIGSLSLELEELRSNVVGAKLGEEALNSSLKAGAIGFALVCVFMIAVYLVPGLAASLALCLYVVLMIVLLAAFEVTLTLPGIAGIILSVGMAVDANVIIFTRIKEEIGLGKAVHSAIKSGFSKAMSAIIDGNVTTLIAAAVLYWRGSGTVKGFAVTLAIGIILSMLTALFVTKFLMNCLYNLGFQDKKFYGVRKEKKPVNFIGKRKLFFALSAVIILAGVGAMLLNKGSIGGAFNYGLDFKGGTSTSVTFNEDMSLEQISSEVVPVVESVTKSADTQTQKVAGTTEVIIKTRTLSVDEREALNAALVESFGVDDSKIVAESISGAISSEMKSDAIMATVLATIFMLLYIWLRFKDIRFAAGAVLALVHDVLVVLACYAAFKWSIGSTAIACLLTIVGYSINATIVVFDRIREMQKLPGANRKTREEIANAAITQTFTRSLNTSLTTFIMVLVLYIMGVSSIREFSLPLMAGIACGTYSSVCLASAFWYVMMGAKEKKAAAAAAAAKAEKVQNAQKESQPEKAAETGKKKRKRKAAEAPGSAEKEMGAELPELKAEDAAAETEGTEAKPEKAAAESVGMKPEGTAAESKSEEAETKPEEAAVKPEEEKPEETIAEPTEVKTETEPEEAALKPAEPKQEAAPEPQEPKTEEAAAVAAAPEAAEQAENE